MDLTKDILENSLIDNDESSKIRKNIFELVAKYSKISHWIFGHTHDRFIRNINGVKCCVNALGYKKKVEIDEINI